MDETLTHLDARGRESVGRLLRALVRRTDENHTYRVDVKSHKVEDRNKKVSLSSLKDIEYTEAGESQSESQFNTSNARTNRFALTADEGSATCVPYETIIVILQDVVATELEEAFDHIDIVKKESDIATVLIDL